MADFVNDFFSNPIDENLAGTFCGNTTVGGRLQSIRGDDASVPIEIRQAKNVISPSVIEIFGGDCDIFLARSDRTCEFDKLFCSILPTLPIE